MTMNTLIHTTNLTKSYEDFCLGPCDLTVENDRVVGLIGSNGAGKTTLFKLLLGITRPDSGQIELLGINPYDPSAALDAVKERIGVVLDTCAFPTTLKVKDVDSLGNAAYPHWDRPYFRSLCKRFDLAPKKLVKDLSRGMGMKLSLVFALAHHPDLLILDEATAGLDPIARDKILDMLREFMEQDGHGVLMSSHITTDLEKIADEIVCIDHGSLIFSLPKEEICDEAGVAHCRAADLEAIKASPYAATHSLKVLSRGMSSEVLVPDRFAFAQAFPAIPIDRTSIEDYMTITLKGESL